MKLQNNKRASSGENMCRYAKETMRWAEEPENPCTGDGDGDETSSPANCCWSVSVRVDGETAVEEESACMKTTDYCHSN